MIHLISALVFVVTAAVVYGTYRIASHYSREYWESVQYRAFVEDLVKEETNRIILRLSAPNWFAVFARNTDQRLTNVLLRQLSRALKQGTYMENRPATMGRALGHLSTINKKCQKRALTITAELVVRHENPAYITMLMETNPKLPTKQFVPLITKLDGPAKRELIDTLRKYPDAQKLLLLI